MFVQTESVVESCSRALHKRNNTRLYGWCVAESNHKLLEYVSLTRRDRLALTAVAVDIYE